MALLRGRQSRPSVRMSTGRNVKDSESSRNYQRDHGALVRSAPSYLREDAMRNSMESAGERSQSTGDGSIGSPRPNDRQSGMSETATSQGESLIEKAKSTAQERVRSAVGGRKNQAVETVSGLAQSLLL